MPNSFSEDDMIFGGLEYTFNPDPYPLNFEFVFIPEIRLPRAVCSAQEPARQEC